MENYNISISLYPVTGITTLRANPKTKPSDLDKFIFIQKGKLGKRITIKWEDLISMKAEKNDIYIAVETSQKGEYLLKVDAHEPHFQGSLSPGYSETGFVKMDQVNKYLTSFKVWDEQKVRFTLKMQIFSGSADIHIKRCKENQVCDFDMNQLSNKTKIQENKDNEYERTLESSCKQKSCSFLIIIIGRENHGTHYEVSVQEEKFHYLMTPGHSVSVNCLEEQAKYFKYSYPGVHNKDNKLKFQMEPHWGNFQIFISKNNEYPDETNNDFSKLFISENLSMTQSSQILEISQIVKNFTSGQLYIAVKATSSSKVNIKFFEQQTDVMQIHSLTAGKVEQGVLSNNGQIVYYLINISLQEEQAQTVSIDLIPIKGKFIMVASRSDKLPSINQNDLKSSDNHLDLNYKTYQQDHSYSIGVMPFDYDFKNPKSVELIYKIGLSYRNKTTKLLPGIIHTHTLNEENFFTIQILKEMKNILLLKSVIDGYNISICGKFYENSNITSNNECEIQSDDKYMGEYIPQNILEKYCKEFYEKSGQCNLNLSVLGDTSQLFSIGFTYNDLPFQLVNTNVITGPGVISDKMRINFIYHPDKSQSLQIYFNSKGQRMKILTQLIEGNEIDDKNILSFPTLANYDDENQTQKSFISSVYYDQNEIQKKENPEILISIQSQKTSVNQQPFDSLNGFILQAYNDAYELHRTQVHQEYILAEKQYYFYFYNNGNSEQIEIYINSTTAAFFDVQITKGKGMRSGLERKTLKQEKGSNSVKIYLGQGDLQEGETLKGYYTISLSAERNTFMNIFWNNNPKLNYFEINHNIPTQVHVFSHKNLFFNFFVEEVPDVTNGQKNSPIYFYFKGDSETNIYIKKTEGKELITPSEQNYDFKGHIGNKGGVGFIKIDQNHDQYCVQCNYIGVIKSSLEGQLTTLLNIQHSNHPINIQPGFSFPDHLDKKSGKTFRYLNVNSEPFYISLSMLNGYCNIYIDIKQEITFEDAKKSFNFSKNQKRHNFIKIDPNDFDQAQEFFIRVENQKIDSAEYTITVYNNDSHHPLEIGITKNIELGPKDFLNLFFKQKEGEKIYEIRFTLTGVSNDKNKSHALQNIFKFIDIGYLKGDSFQKLKTISEESYDNKHYIQFDASENNLGEFNLRIKNKFQYSIKGKVDLLSGDYKLLNLNDTYVDYLIQQNTHLYEAFGQVDRFWFIEIRQCYGNQELNFYYDYEDYKNKKNAIQQKQIIESSFNVHYFTLEQPHIYIEIKNKDSDRSVYLLSAYNEQDLTDNPYQQLVTQDDGRVMVDTSNKVLSFKPLRIIDYDDDSLVHEVQYKVYLSKDFDQMRFAKSCGQHHIKKIFPDSQVIKLQQIKTYNGSKELNQEKNIQIKIEGLEFKQKYFGIVVATTKLYLQEEGQIEPINQSHTIYDEFILVTEKVNFSLALWSSTLIILALMIGLGFIVNSYLFGEIYRLKSIKEDLAFITESGFDTIDILDSDFQIEERTRNEQDQREQDDRAAPLDIDFNQ